MATQVVAAPEVLVLEVGGSWKSRASECFADEEKKGKCYRRRWNSLEGGCICSIANHSTTVSREETKIWRLLTEFECLQFVSWGALQVRRRPLAS
jgi:hypothetical protein